MDVISCFHLSYKLINFLKENPHSKETKNIGVFQIVLGKFRQCSVYTTLKKIWNEKKKQQMQNSKKRTWNDNNYNGRSKINISYNLRFKKYRVVRKFWLLNPIFQSVEVRANHLKLKKICMDKQDFRTTL